jgi:hypothetical protein
MHLNTPSICLAAILLAVGGRTAGAQTPQPTLPERVAMLKAAFASSQAQLRSYEWIETTVVSLNGEEKSRKQQRCYYGADGVLQKVIVDSSPPPEAKRGLRGRIVANKTAELTDYMKNAVGLVKSYVPPDPAKIQAAKDGGNANVQVLEPGKRVQVNFRNYEKPGDNLAVLIDVAKNIVAGVGVSTYLDSPTDIVTLDARMGQLNDGTIYTSDITLSASAKKLAVSVQNTGYRRTN